MQKDVSASETIKPVRFFPRIWRQGRNYSTIVGWLLRRAFTGRLTPAVRQESRTDLSAGL